jgi:Transglycosylase-like domain
VGSGRRMKFRRTGWHTTLSQVEKIAEKAGKAAPAMAVAAGVLLSAPHGHSTAPAKHDTVAAQSITSKAAPAQTVALTSASSTSVPGGSFGACVVSRESGGNPQVMNSSGHYGLYQFSASTWARYGGNPADFGHASAAEQNKVFATALAQGGRFNWSPYDGC